MKRKISVVLAIVSILSHDASASFCPAISLAATGAVVLGLGGGLFAVSKQEKAAFLKSHNSSLFNATDYYTLKKTCFTEFGGFNHGWLKHDFTGYVQGEYPVYVDGKSFNQNVTRGDACGNTPDEALARIQLDYPQSNLIPIWYEISNPEKFTKDGILMHDYKTGFSIALFVIGGVLTASSVLSFLYHCKSSCKRMGYSEIQGPDFAMDKMRE